MIICPDCKNEHPPFDISCPIFRKYKIVNAIIIAIIINSKLKD